MSLNTSKLAFITEFIALDLFRLTETKLDATSLTIWWSMEAKTFIMSTYSIVDIHGAWIPCLYLSSSLLSSPPVFPHPLCSTQRLWGSPLSCFHSSGNHHPSEALISLGKEVAIQYGVQWVSQTVFTDFAKIAFFFL